MEYFEDYYDEEGNLHIDARKPKQKSTTKNFRFYFNKDNMQDSLPQKKIVIPHCNLTDIK